MKNENGTIQPENAFNAELEEYQQKIDAAYKQLDAETQAAKDLYDDCLHNEDEFRTLCEDYNLSFNNELMRALKMLDLSIMGKLYAQDAIHTALNQIKIKLLIACQSEVSDD